MVVGDHFAVAVGRPAGSDVAAAVAGSCAPSLEAALAGRGFADAAARLEAVSSYYVVAGRVGAGGVWTVTHSTLPARRGERVFGSVMLRDGLLVESAAGGLTRRWRVTQEAGVASIAALFPAAAAAAGAAR